MEFDVQAARAAGHTDRTIADYLGKESGIDVAAAEKAGHKTSDIINYLSTGAKPSAPVAPAPAAPKERSWSDAISDTGRGLMSGGAGVVKSAGDLFGLATGDMDNAASRLGADAQEYWEQGQSDTLKAKRLERKAAIDGADSIAGKAWQAFKGTVTDPALAADALSSNIATMVPGMAVGRAAQGAKLASGMAAAGESVVAQQAAAQAAARFGVGAAVGTGALQQGADVSGDVYADIMKKPDSVWLENPEFMSRLEAAPDRSAQGIQALKQEFALKAARATMPAATAISVAANAIPGGTMLERAFVGGAARNTIKEGTKYGVLKATGKSALGNTGEEVIEEGGGAFAGNVAKRAYVDANQSLDDGVGENAGMGAAGGLLMGAAGGAMQRADTRRPVEIRKAIDDTADDFAAEHGISSKAVQAARAKAETMPIAAVPGFYRKFFGAFAGKTGRQIDETGFAGFDDLTDKLTLKPVAPIIDTPAATMQSIEALESAQNTDQAQSIQGQAATDSIADNGGIDTGNDVVVTAETDAVNAAATSPLNDLPEPTQAQKDAGNYKLGRMRVAGMDIAIENPQGSVRRGVSQDGTAWETPLKHHYGYFNGTTANDGDKLDVFVQPGTPEDFKGAVYVVDQIDPATGALDEHKVLIGPKTEDEARAMYAANYDSNWQGLGAITRLPLPAFKAWAKSGALKEPLGDIQIPQTAPTTQTPAIDPAPAPDTAALPVPATAGGVPVDTGTAEQSDASLNQPVVQQTPAQAAPESIAPETSDVVDLAAERTRRNDALVELRKRHSVLVSLRKCMGG